MSGMLDKRRLGTFVVGGIAGAVAGILLAPRSGKELRGSISNRAGEARERGRETYFDAHERVQERLTEGLERPPRLADSAYPTTTQETSPDDQLLSALGREEPALEPFPPFGEAPPNLRDVSRDAPGEEQRGVAGEEDPEVEPDPEEIRRKIRETRSRLRARLDRPGGPGEGRDV